MKTLQIIFICVVALEHFYFMILEMFLWTTPKGIKAFGLKSKEFANDTKVLAANQGLYNGFIHVDIRKQDRLSLWDNSSWYIL